MSNQQRFLKLNTTPHRIGPVAAMCLVKLALEGKVILSQSDLEELETVIIACITSLEHDLLDGPPDTEPGVSHE